MSERPRVVLVCHEADRIDAEGLAAWLTTSLRLVGIVAIREARGHIVRRMHRGIRRVGLLWFLAAAAVRLYYRATRRENALPGNEAIVTSSPRMSGRMHCAGPIHRLRGEPARFCRPARTAPAQRLWEWMVWSTKKRLKSLVAVTILWRHDVAALRGT